MYFFQEERSSILANAYNGPNNKSTRASKVVTVEPRLMERKTTIRQPTDGEFHQQHLNAIVGHPCNYSRHIFAVHSCK